MSVALFPCPGCLNFWTFCPHVEMEGLFMDTGVNQDQSYKVGHIEFIVTPIYREGHGETIYELLLKMMKADAREKE